MAGAYPAQGRALHHTTNGVLAMAPRSRPRRGKARVRAIEAGREEGKDGVVRTASLFLSISCFGGPISRLQPQPALVLLRHSVCCTQRNGTGDGASPGTLPRGGKGRLAEVTVQPTSGRAVARSHRRAGKLGLGKAMGTISQCCGRSEDTWEVRDRAAAG